MSKQFLLVTSPFSQLMPNLDCWWVQPRRMWRHCSSRLKLSLLEAPAGRLTRVGRGRSCDGQQLLQTASPSSRPGELNFETWIELDFYPLSWNELWILNWIESLPLQSGSCCSFWSWRGPWRCPPSSRTSSFLASWSSSSILTVSL